MNTWALFLSFPVSKLSVLSTTSPPPDGSRVMLKKQSVGWKGKLWASVHGQQRCKGEDQAFRDISFEE
jgi:hypothetical protein